MIFFRWIRERFLLFRRILIELYNRVIYQPQSQFLLHRLNAHRCQEEPFLFYSFVGRLGFAIKEIIALFTDSKIFKKSIIIDGFEDIDYRELYKKGNSIILYPKSPMVMAEKAKIEDSYYDKIANSFILAYTYNKEQRDISSEWERISSEFRAIFFDKNSNIIKENLENFRGDPKIYNKIFNNQYPYIEQKDGYIKNYLKAIDLVLEYHRYGATIKKEMLASVSESMAGNYLSVNYRGRKISEQLLQHTVIVHDLVTNIPFSTTKKDIVLDIGCGFGGSARLLNIYIPNTVQILLDLPETLFLTAYYLKYNFPNKKIALLEDIYPHLDSLDDIILEYDFIVIPPFVLDYLKEESIDVVVNASSLAFMSKEYLEYYLEQTKRVLKSGGYFYSLNTTQDSQWGVGSYNWDYKADYLTLYFNYNNRFAFPQWLGRKV